MNWRLPVLSIGKKSSHNHFDRGLSANTKSKVSSSPSATGRVRRNSILNSVLPSPFPIRHGLPFVKSRPQFSPLCDLHHTPMQRVMLEEESEEVRSYHACQRQDCSRVFRDSTGYSDWLSGRFDQSRSSARRCPTCDAILYLAEVDHLRKIETWECPQDGCEFYEEFPSPAAQ